MKNKLKQNDFAKLASILITLTFLLGGCSATVPIKQLTLPPVTVIEGKIIQLDAKGFTLKDASDTIYVKATLSSPQKLVLSLNESLKVYGNLEPGEPRIFEAYVIEKSSGKQIILHRPTPHFGFILQTSFD